MPTIIFTAGAKGGTGKSTAVRFLTTYLRERGFSPLLLDMDDENHTLSRFFPEAQRVEIKNSFSNDLLVERILGGGKLLIADLKAGSGRDTLDWWLGVPFDELTDIQFICVGAVTSSPDSVQTFLNWAAALKGRVKYVVCKNQKDGETFPDFDTSEQSLVFRDKYNPIEVDIPHLDAEYMTELERLNLTISEVLEANGNDAINGKPVGQILCKLMVRSRLRRFQSEIYEQFEPVLKFIKA